MSVVHTVARHFRLRPPRNKGVVRALREGGEKPQPFRFTAGNLKKRHRVANSKAVFPRGPFKRFFVKAKCGRRIAAFFRGENGRQLIEVQRIRHFCDGSGFQAGTRSAFPAEASCEFLDVSALSVGISERQKPQFFKFCGGIVFVDGEVSVHGRECLRVVSGKSLGDGSVQRFVSCAGTHRHGEKPENNERVFQRHDPTQCG